MEFLVSSLGQPSEPERVVCDFLKETSVITSQHEGERRQEAKISLAAPSV